MHMIRISVRPTTPEDLPAIKKILDATELFPSELLDEMAAGALAGGECEERWLSADGGNGPLGFAYYVPERMTEGTWNLLAIAVDPGHQGRGVGAALVGRIERDLRDRGQRVLLVETSGLREFERARAFYRANDFDEEARIRDFHASGDDKVVFWKAVA